MWFRKKKKEKNKTYATISDKMAEKIAGAGLKIQVKFSNTMNKIFSYISPKKLKVLLALFCLCSGGFSIYLFADAIFSPRTPTNNLKVDPINVPRHFDRAGDDPIEPQYYVDKETYIEIQAFRHYMDSLKSDQQGRWEYDSIMRVRPGLMDSALMLEKIFLSQQ